MFDKKIPYYQETKAIEVRVPASIVCYITVSTGLGGGVVIDKNIYHGSNNLGAYFSRMILDGKNTSNSLISGTALLNQAKEKISENIKDIFELFELEKKGNKIATEIILAKKLFNN